MSSLSSNKRYLIINADDFGMCHSANQAIIKMLNDKVITSTSIMPVCPWYEEAAEYLRDNPHVDAGAHLTFTSEWTHYKWSPISKNDSLVDASGYLPSTSRHLQENASQEAVINEIRLQLDKIKQSGISITNIDNHMGSLYGLETGNSFLPAIIHICSELNMPFRLPKKFPEERVQNMHGQQLEAFQKLIGYAESKNVKLIDYLIEYPFHMQEGETYQKYIEMIINILRNLQAGVSELYIHPALESEEIKGINPSWQKRVMEYRAFYEDEVQQVINSEGIELISWRDL